MITVFLRTLIVYIILIGVMRLMGKRQVGELQVSELVITLMLSELAVFPIEDKEIPLSYSIVPIIVLLSVEVIISFLMTKSVWLKRLLCGEPSMIIYRGKLDQKEMGRLRLSMSELEGELRQKNVADIADIDYAILEDNGKLSVFLKGGRAPVTGDDAGLEIKQTGIAHAIVLDGKINTASLKYAAKNEKWLNKTLRERKIKLEDIFIMTVNDAGDLNMIMREKDA